MTRANRQSNRRITGADWRGEDAMRQLPPKGVTTGAPHRSIGADRRTTVAAGVGR
jgi:hypothetical protein